jgi:hypothetical protein
MGEAVTAVSTILFFVAAFLGSGAYGVLSLNDYRAARRGFWATAINFALIGVALGVMTTWSLPVRMAVTGGFSLLAAGSLVWILDYVNLREKMGLTEAQPNFAYVGTLSQAENPGADHLAFVFAHEPKSILNVNITFQPESNPAQVYRFMLPILYQEGAPFVPIGSVHTLMLPPGNYIASIQTQDGTFMERLGLRLEDGKLKRDILVYKSLPPGESGTLSPILQIRD